MYRISFRLILVALTLSHSPSTILRAASPPAPSPALSTDAKPASSPGPLLHPSATPTAEGEPVKDARALQSTQRVHFLGAFNTADKAIGEACNANRALIRDAIRSGVAANQLNLIEVLGSDCTYPGLRAAIDRIRLGRGARQPAFAAKTDTLVIYLSTLGFQEGSRPQRFLTADGKHITRDTLRTLANLLNPRLLVVITDSVRIDNREYNAGINASYLDVAEYTKTAFRTLFLEPEGIIDINASQQGEIARGNQLLGSYFSYAFTMSMQNSKTHSMNWADLLSMVNTYVHQHFPDSPQTACALTPLPPSALVREPEKPRFGAHAQITAMGKKFNGLEILEVDPGSPADTGVFLIDEGKRTPSKISSAHYVITTVNDHPITTQEQLVRAVHESPTTMRFTLVDVSTGVSQQYETNLLGRVGHRFGIVPVDSEVVGRLNGVSIAEVIPQSAATRVIRRSDGKQITLLPNYYVITSINGHRVTTAQEIFELVRDSGQRMSFTAKEQSETKGEYIDMDIEYEVELPS